MFSHPLPNQLFLSPQHSHVYPEQWFFSQTSTATNMHADLPDATTCTACTQLAEYRPSSLASVQHETAATVQVPMYAVDLAPSGVSLFSDDPFVQHNKHGEKQKQQITEEQMTDEGVVSVASLLPLHHSLPLIPSLSADVFLFVADALSDSLSLLLGMCITIAQHQTQGRKLRERLPFYKQTSQQHLDQPIIVFLHTHHTTEQDLHIMRQYTEDTFTHIHIREYSVLGDIDEYLLSIPSLSPAALPRLVVIDELPRPARSAGMEEAESWKANISALDYTLSLCTQTCNYWSTLHRATHHAACYDRCVSSVSCGLFPCQVFVHLTALTPSAVNSNNEEASSLTLVRAMSQSTLPCPSPHFPLSVWLPPLPIFTGIIRRHCREVIVTQVTANAMNENEYQLQVFPVACIQEIQHQQATWGNTYTYSTHHKLQQGEDSNSTPRNDTRPKLLKEQTDQELLKRMPSSLTSMLAEMIGDTTLYDNVWNPVGPRSRSSSNYRYRAREGGVNEQTEDRCMDMYH